ncbi:MAG: YkgJ family cysteine cluster protein [Halodesulfurarchaeum sp.]
MQTLEAALERVDALRVEEVADAIQTIGFLCTRCGACCSGSEDHPHTATIFPHEIRAIRDARDVTWSEVARPMPFGLDGGSGSTFEWALQTDDAGGCTFHATHGESGSRCSVYEDRPLICRTYPFGIDVESARDRTEGVVRAEGVVVAYECPGLGRDIGRERAEQLAELLCHRSKRELEEAIAVRENYAAVPASEESIVVHDSEGAKGPDGSRITTD